jgi:hypothetical protein
MSVAKCIPCGKKPACRGLEHIRKIFLWLEKVRCFRNGLFLRIRVYGYALGRLLKALPLFPEYASSIPAAWLEGPSCSSPKCLAISKGAQALNHAASIVLLSAGH